MSDQPPSRGEMIRRAAATAVPGGVGRALTSIADDMRARRRVWADEVAEQVAITVGDDSLLVMRLQDERLAFLLLEAVEAAARTVLQEKRRLLGRVVGRAVLDDAAVDESQLVVGALRDLDIPHLRALERLRRVEDRLRDEMESSGGTYSERAASASSDAITDAVGTASRQEPEPIRSALIAAGAVVPATLLGGGIVVYRLSGFGRRLLDDLRDAAVG